MKISLSNARGPLRNIVIAVGAAAMIGAAPAPKNPAYMPYLGAWSCTRPTLGPVGWTGDLTVSETSTGKLEFAARQTSRLASATQRRKRVSPSYFGPDHFFISQDPKTGAWTESAPANPLPKTGSVQSDGSLLFSAPYPNHQRFALKLMEHDRSMKMLWYLNNNITKLNYAPDVIECKR